METIVKLDDASVMKYAKDKLGMTTDKAKNQYTTLELFREAFLRPNWTDVFGDNEFLEEVKDEFGLLDEDEALDYARDEGYIDESDALDYAEREGYMDEDAAWEWAKDRLKDLVDDS